MNKKHEIKLSIIENDDYYYRDQETFRNDIENINHEIDPTYNKTKEKKKHHSN